MGPAVRRLTAALVLAGAALGGAGHAPASADTVLASPEPSPEAPRRLLLQLTSSDEKDINNLFYNAVNVQDFYGQDNAEVVIVAFGAGMQALYADVSPVAERIRSLMRYGVAFIGCANTMKTQNRTPADLIPGVEVVTAGVAEIVERQLAGWVYVRP
ncbi:DsrE family protein [Skermanella sp. TT6]|uniref:DsrE family protein n=1 Tax=Skermanella cutis TaxID=2775420 RepID=A0ABX7B4B3_9PROT|nr:DsrE family protein [Skermanella sp. TT6]QQP88958.1 DsrE family protein [Skermanella sp. TT6]